MAIGYSPKLPLTQDSVDGYYKLNKTLGEVIKQNIKMIVLTSPGERMMQPDFGVGAKHYLFENRMEAFQNFKIRIVDQIKKYLPYVQIVDVSLTEFDLDPGMQQDPNAMKLQIVYKLARAGISDSTTITLTANS